MRVTRRTCLATVVGTALAEEVPSVRLGCQTNAWAVDPTRFETLAHTLTEIKALGFAGFETGFRNVQPRFGQAAETRRELERTGLTFFGVHIFLAQYDPETRVAPLDLATAVAQGGAALGAERLVLSGAPATKNGTFDTDALRRKADGLNAIGEQCGRSGLALAYHNHGPEFAHDGQEIEALLAHTDPARVGLVLDAGHAFRAGANVPQFLQRHRSRIVGMHLRDFRDGDQVPLGQGSFPLAEVAQTANRVRWKGWALAEEERVDGSKPGRAAVGPARARLREVFGA